jgi:predicted aspartyl protease
MSEHPYSAGFRPPAPVLPVLLRAPNGGAGLGLLALLDTGADLSVIPSTAAVALGLPKVSTTRIVGVTGVAESTPVHAAVLEVTGEEHLLEVVAWGDEAILGRDVLNRMLLELDGPRRMLTVGRPPAPRRRLKRVR